MIIYSTTQMISVACATGVGQNQVTQLIAPASNVNGILLQSIYSQVIQPSNPSSNIAQSLVMAALTAPTDFNNKLNCFPIYRTYQDGVQTAVAVAGATPVNVEEIEIPPGWGMWQIVSVTTTALTRNNVRLGVAFH